MFTIVGWHCTLPVHTLLSSPVSNWGVHRVSVQTASPQQWPETAHPPFWSSVCGQTRLLSRKHFCSPLSHLVTEGPPPESGIYFRKTAADSSWMAAETWNPAQIFICFMIIKRFNLKRAGRLYKILPLTDKFSTSHTMSRKCPSSTSTALPKPTSARYRGHTQKRKEPQKQGKQVSLSIEYH